MIDRIKSLLAVKNLTSSQFANEIGVQRSGISHILSGRNKPSLDFILKILDHFPEINEVWLLKGEGEMYKGNSPQELLEKGDVAESSVVNEEIKPDYSMNTEGKVDEQDTVNADNHAETVSSQKTQSKNMLDEVLAGLKSDKIVKLITVYEDNTFDIFIPRK